MSDRAFQSRGLDEWLALNRRLTTRAEPAASIAAESDQPTPLTGSFLHRCPMSDDELIDEYDAEILACRCFWSRKFLDAQDARAVDLDARRHPHQAERSDAHDGGSAAPFGLIDSIDEASGSFITK